MIRNVAASVRARLANKARATGRTVAELERLYGIERFLYRLSVSPHVGSFLLKGGLLLRVWDQPDPRHTRDIDLQGHVSNEVDTLEAVARDICRVSVPDDGMTFDPDTVRVTRSMVNADYQGLHVALDGYFTNTRSRVDIRMDIGFGDVVFPVPQERDYPAILEFPAPRLRTYPPETVIAEKFEVMARMQDAHSRFKDCYDMWVLSRRLEFDGATLAVAIRGTFENRGTEIPANPVVLGPDFAARARTRERWNAFLNRTGIDHAPREFEDVRQPLAEFLLPVVGCLSVGQPFVGEWPPGGHWRRG